MSAAALPPALLEQVIRQTDGIPLFIEEMTKAVLEETTGRPAASEAIVVPSTLQGSLMARLDRLPVAKQVAQIGAVIGGTFPTHCWPPSPTSRLALLVRGLRELVASGLAFQQRRPASRHCTRSNTRSFGTWPTRVCLATDEREIHGAVVAAAETDGGVGMIIPGRLWISLRPGRIDRQGRVLLPGWPVNIPRNTPAFPRPEITWSADCSLPEACRMERDRHLLEAELLIAPRPAADGDQRAIRSRGQQRCSAVPSRVCRQLGDPEMEARSLFALGAIAISRGELQSVQEISANLLDLARVAIGSGRHCDRRPWSGLVS